MINTLPQRKLLHNWIILVIVTQHLVLIGRIDGPAEYLLKIRAGIRSLIGRLERNKEEKSTQGVEPARRSHRACHYCVACPYSGDIASSVEQQESRIESRESRVTSQASGAPQTVLHMRKHPAVGLAVYRL